VLTAAQHALLAVAALTTTSTDSTPTSTTPKQPAPNPDEAHGRKDHGDANGDWTIRQLSPLHATLGRACQVAT